jgi:hypothetical protein
MVKVGVLWEEGSVGGGEGGWGGVVVGGCCGDGGGRGRDGRDGIADRSGLAQRYPGTSGAKGSLGHPRAELAKRSKREGTRMSCQSIR